MTAIKTKQPVLTNMGITELIRKMNEYQDVVSKSPATVISGRISYAIHRNIEALNNAYDHIDGKRLILLNEYGKKGEDGKLEQHKIDDGNGNMIDGIVFETPEREAEYIQKAMLLFQEPMPVNLFQFLDVEAKASECVGDGKVLAILWHLIDTINKCFIEG